MVDIGLRVLTKPDPLALPQIYRRLGKDYDDKVLPSIITEVVKQVIAQFNATSLLTQREQVSRKIKDLLSERAKEFHILLEVQSAPLLRLWRGRDRPIFSRAVLLVPFQDVSITDLKFGREFELAVERKQVAQQDAERARFIVDMAQQVGCASHWPGARRSSHTRLSPCFTHTHTRSTTFSHHLNCAG